MLVRHRAWRAFEHNVGGSINDQQSRKCRWTADLGTSRALCIHSRCERPFLSAVHLWTGRVGTSCLLGFDRRHVPIHRHSSTQPSRRPAVRNGGPGICGIANHRVHHDAVAACHRTGRARSHRFDVATQSHGKQIRRARSPGSVYLRLWADRLVHGCVRLNEEPLPTTPSTRTCKSAASLCFCTPVMANVGRSSRVHA